MSQRAQIEHSLITTYRSRFWSPFIRAIKEYELILPGDRIAVMLSGGKDSFLLAKLFEELHRHGKKNFGLVLIGMDPGYAEENRKKVEELQALLEHPLHLYERDVFSASKKMNEKNPCYLCARMRRGVLYDLAKKHDCNKIALGHHFDDVIETALMNVLVGGMTMAMMPKLHSTSHPEMELIRPLYYVRERDILLWQEAMELEFLDCACEVAARELPSMRREIKELIPMLKERFTHVEDAIFHSTKNVHTGAILGTVVKGKKHSFLETYSLQQTIDKKSGEEESQEKPLP